MDNVEGIVLIIGMLITFIGIPTYCICCGYKNDKIKGFYKGYPSLFINFAIRFPLTFALQFEILKLLP